MARASQQAFTRGHPIRNNPLVQYMAKLPRGAEPGTRFNYNTGETDLVGLALARALVAGADSRLRRSLLSPLSTGASDAAGASSRRPRTS